MWRLIVLFLACTLSNHFVQSNKEINKNITLPKYITFPLIWQKSPRVKLLEMGVHPNVIQSLEKMPLKVYESGIEKKKKPVKNDTVQLFKYLDNEFFAQVYLGHPGKAFNLILDTSWADSFVPSITCSAIACKTKNKYDHDKSSQYVNPNKIYDKNGMTGDLAMDLLHLGHVNVTNFTFAEISNMPKTMLFNKADGILGMGFKELNKYNSLPFFYRLTQLNPQMAKVFSFYFNREPSTPKGGTLALGFVQAKHYMAPINYFNVTSTDYWQLNMDKVILEERKTKNDTLCATGCKVLIDTGSTTIGVPTDDLNTINKITRASNAFGRFSVDCKLVHKLPDIHFIFNGIEHSLRGKEYVQNLDIGPLHLCVTAFVSSPLNGIWTLGGTFLYRHYSVFDVDKRQIGLAKARL